MHIDDTLSIKSTKQRARAAELLEDDSRSTAGFRDDDSLRPNNGDEGYCGWPGTLD